MLKKFFILLLIVLVIIQFIRPSRNVSVVMSENDITKHYAVPENVQSVLKKACYDCHSNNTTYPWYVNIQPIAWWMQHHVNEGKEELNFSEFTTYVPKRQHHKLEEVMEQVEEKEMPLSSYTWLHKNARLSEEERQLLNDWAKSLKDEIATKYSLPVERK